MRRLPSRSARAVALAAAVCALAVAAGCNQESFNLLPDLALDSAGRAQAAGTRNDSGSAGIGGSSGASGKGGAGGRLEVAGSGGRFSTFPGGGPNNFPCIGEGGCPDEGPPCSQSDPFCLPCRYKSECAFVEAKICDQELRRCVQCRTDTQCDMGDHCNTNTWRCAKACGVGKDGCSADGQHLTCSVEFGGVCVECTDNGDCASYGPYNSKCASNVCVQCAEDAHCASSVCVNGRCIH